MFVRDFSCATFDFSLACGTQIIILWQGREKYKKVSLLNALLRARQLLRRFFLVLTKNERIVVEENCFLGEEVVINEAVNLVNFWISLVGNKHVIKYMFFTCHSICLTRTCELFLPYSVG